MTQGAFQLLRLNFVGMTDEFNELVVAGRDAPILTTCCNVLRFKSFLRFSMSL